MDDELMQEQGDSLPLEAEVIVVGGGSGGAAAAGTIAARSSKRVVLLEAGPDYGPKDSGRWPEAFLDPAIRLLSHDWGYSGVVAGRTLTFHRARVLGGCSAHNDGAIVYGSRSDFDGWASAGNPGWEAESIIPIFRSAATQMEVRRVPYEELTPFSAACHDAIAATGIPAVKDLNNLDERIGVAPFPTNQDANGVRINSAFGYVDPVRGEENMTVIGGAPVERVLVNNGRVSGVEVRFAGKLQRIAAPVVVLGGGAYGSPATLLRSGVGPADELRALGIEPVLDLPGVGRNLHDQPAVMFNYAGSADLATRMRSFVHTGRRRSEQVIAKLPSSGCRTGFDLHIYPIGGPLDEPHPSGRMIGYTLGGAVLTPKSRGYVRLTGPQLSDPLAIDHAYLSDPEGNDLRRLVEVAERIRATVADTELASLLGDELTPGPQLSGERLRAFLRDAQVFHYGHQAGSCKMGPGTDRMAVVDANGQVHGVEGLFVGDASVMPMVVSGNTNMPCVVIGEKLGRHVAALS